MPCVGDREDGRYPKITPQEQIKMIDEELRIATETPNFFGITFWISGCQRLGIVTADSFLNNRFYKLINLSIIFEFHFQFRRMNIHIGFFRIDIKE